MVKNLDLVHWLLDRLNTPEPGRNNWTPRREVHNSLLGLAVENGTRAVIKRLLGNGEIVEAGQWKDLIKCCFESSSFPQVDRKVVKWICRKKISTEGEGGLLNNHLLFVCKQIFKEGDVDLLRFMITMGLVDVNRQDKEGMTILQRAARNGQPVVVKALLACGAEPQLPPRRKRGSGPSKVKANIAQEIQAIIKKAITEREANEAGGEQGKKRKQPGKTTEGDKKETECEKVREPQTKARRLEQRSPLE